MRLTRISEAIRKGLWTLGFARGATLALLINVSGILLGFSAQLVLARTLGPQQFGIYAYAVAWVMMLSLIATLGYGESVMRFVPKYCLDKDWSLLRGLIRDAEASILYASFGIAGAGALAIIVLGDGATSHLSQTLLLGLLVIPLMALTQLRSFLARSLGRVFSALAPSTIVRPMTVVVLVSFLALIPHYEVNAFASMGAMLSGAFLALLLLTIFTRSAYPTSMYAAPIGNDRALWRRTSLQLLLVTVAQQCMNQNDILLLGWLADTTIAGVYIVATQIANVTLLSLLAMNQLIGPKVSALYAEGNTRELQNLVRLTSWWIFIVNLFLATPIFILSPFIMRMFFGDGGSEGTLMLRLILVGQIINCSFGSIVYLLTMTGHQSKATAVFGCVALASAALNGILIPLYGAEGAATSKVFTLIAWNVSMALLVRRHLGIIPGIYDRSHERY